ncbi:hypothetical protein [Comamonas jiangduensis]|uniref:hypothetical protein n=1 Tax=Comamonas jiangduensis TaxID=1194168 RepID=UPI0015817678|nr:hypothetical protein [Comamonas jiangduensis]
MDFPKSVPGVGLVGGEFVNEDPVLGQQGSLIPAEWGNAVTKELVAVIEEDGQTPSELVLTQLRDALYGAVSSIKRRLLRIASVEDMSDGNCDDAAVTPKKLRAGFSWSFGSSVSYIAFPSWLMGVIFFWGGTIVTARVYATVTLPISMPSGAAPIVVGNWGTGSVSGAQVGAVAFMDSGPSSFKVTVSDSSGTFGCRFIGIGR